MDRERRQTLFGEVIEESRESVEPRRVGLADEPRLRRVDRAQVVLRPCSLEDLLEAEHPARVVWDVVGRWNLDKFLSVVKARGEVPGRAASDPRLLISLWLYAYTQGIGGGRELARLCDAHDAYRWICGGVSLNYHTLNDFRVDHGAALDDLLTQMIAALISQKLVKVTRISQDGTRVRAGAGCGSFKKRESLEHHLGEARAHVEAMKQQADDSKVSAQRKKAAQRAARQLVERIEKAMIELAKVQAAKAAQKDKPSKHRPAKASTTDPEARQMRMPGGGTAPGYNVQFATATQGRAIVGVEVTNAGSDVAESGPMRQQVQQRTGQQISEQLVDGGYVGLDQIEAAGDQGVAIYAPLPKSKNPQIDPYQPKKADGLHVGNWRIRMGTIQARCIYKERAATSETANAECKTYRGLGPMLIRGLAKVRCVALGSALAYNLMHFGTQLAA
jgi:transposase